MYATSKTTVQMTSLLLALGSAAACDLRIPVPVPAADARVTESIDHPRSTTSCAPFVDDLDPACGKDEDKAKE